MTRLILLLILTMASGCGWAYVIGDGQGYSYEPTLEEIYQFSTASYRPTIEIPSPPDNVLTSTESLNETSEYIWIFELDLEYPESQFYDLKRTSETVKVDIVNLHSIRYGEYRKYIKVPYSIEKTECFEWTTPSGFVLDFKDLRGNPYEPEKCSKELVYFTDNRVAWRKVK